jgi:hypothetical protein
MNIWKIGFIVRLGVSALVVAFLLGYAAHHAWAATQDDEPSRSEAIRRLVELGLKAKK